MTNKSQLSSRQYLRPEASDCKEASIAASLYSVTGEIIGWVWGGVKNGTLLSSRGGNSTPAACDIYLYIDYLEYFIIKVS